MLENFPDMSKALDSMSSTKERVGRKTKFNMAMLLTPLDIETHGIN